MCTIEEPADPAADSAGQREHASEIEVVAVGESPRDRRDEPTAALFASLAAANDLTVQRRLRSQIIELNMDIARDTARRHRGLADSLEDLQQVACLALVHAVARYKQAHGTPFHLFATRTISNEFKQHVRDRA